MSSRLCPFCMQMAEGDACPHCGKHTNYEGNPMHLPAGCVVHGAHPYVIGAALGQGGFGITYIALDMVTGVRVAIKEFFPTFCSGRTGGSNVMPYQGQEESFSKGKARFLEEAQVLKSLSDLNCVVNVLDFFQFNNSAYLVMEFLEGSSLKGYVKKEGRLPADMLFRQIRPLMEDIHRMHQRGVVHRDIAPDNIIVLPNGSMKLIDFGAARSFFGDKSMTVVVKKGFAPVEQYMSKGTSAATDVYALAATIYYCITGTVPMDSAERQYDGTVLQSPNSLGAKLTPAQEKALSRALEILQKNRTQTVQQFLDDLRVSDVVPPKASVPKKDADSPYAFKKYLPHVLIGVAAVLTLLSGYFLRLDRIPTSSTTEEPVASVAEAVSEVLAPTIPTETTPTESFTEPQILYTNPLTGEPLNQPHITRIFAVTLNNVPDALPHVGTMDADMVFEMYVKGYATRCLALFSDIRDAETVGSVRSWQYNFTDIALAYDAFACHAGKTDNNQAVIDHYNIDTNNQSSYSFRDKARSKAGYPWEHCLFMKGKGIYDYLSSKEVRLTINPEKHYSMIFAQDGTPADGEDALQIDLTFRIGDRTKLTTLTYREDLGKYAWTQYGEELGNVPNEEFELFENVLILFSNVKTISGSYHVADLNTTGNGYFACGGKIIPIKWIHENSTDDFTFTLTDGTVLYQGIGNSYIGICPLESSVEWE